MLSPILYTVLSMLNGIVFIVEFVIRLNLWPSPYYDLQLCFKYYSL